MVSIIKIIFAAHFIFVSVADSLTSSIFLFKRMKTSENSRGWFTQAQTQTSALPVCLAHLPNFANGQALSPLLAAL